MLFVKVPLLLVFQQFISFSHDCTCDFFDSLGVGIVEQSFLNIRSSAGLNPTSSGMLRYANKPGKDHLPFSTSS